MRCASSIRALAPATRQLKTLRTTRPAPVPTVLTQGEERQFLSVMMILSFGKILLILSKTSVPGSPAVGCGSRTVGCSRLWKVLVGCGSSLAYNS